MSNTANGAKRITRNARKYRTDDGLRIRRARPTTRRTATRQAYVAAAITGKV